MDMPSPLHPDLAASLRQSSLAEFVPAYCRYLADRRYAATTQRLYLRCVAHFAHWLSRHGRTVSEISREDIRAFLDRHLPQCHCPPPVRRCRHDIRAALRHLWALLCGAQVVAEDQSADTIEVELRHYDDHLLRERGLASNTRSQRLRVVRAFLSQTHGSSPAELRPVRADDLRRFIDDTLQRWQPASAHVLVNTLRSYLRFRALAGDAVDHLLSVITSPANWRLAPLPQILSSEEIAHLLASFPKEGRCACRAHAMLRCVVDLGLRASEVVGLDLDDIDWRLGTVRVGPNKSRRVDLLPLPQVTGKAIATYLRSERPATSNRRVFVRHVAPFDEPIGPGVVRRAVCEAFQRSGLSHTRVHVLRHSLAGRLLEEGATIKEVADVLRHRALDTTLLYAKIDVARMAAVALPWPEDVS